MKESDKEYLEYWLSELKHEVGDYRTELNIINNKKIELRIQKTVIGDLLRIHSDDFVKSTEKFRHHFNFDQILAEYKEIHSDEQYEKEAELEEKIHFTELAIQRIETILQPENTPA